MARHRRVKSLEVRGLGMEKRYSEDQIIGFLQEAETGLPIMELCRRYGFSKASY